MKIWTTQEIRNRAPLLPEQAVLAMAGWGFFHGRFNFSVSILLCFYAMLRTGEVLGIRNSDISMNSGTSPAVISLGLTKGGKRTGAAESVTLTAAVAVKWLWPWKSQNGPHGSLCPSSSVWRKMFKRCLSDLSLSLFEFRPYSLRREDRHARESWSTPDCWTLASSAHGPHLHERRPISASRTTLTP